MSEYCENFEGFEIVLDRYDGITIGQSSFIYDEDGFEEKLERLISKLIGEKRKLLWIYLSIKQATLVPLCAKLGFEFHTCESHKILMVKKLITNPIIPTASNHTLGVGVVVINDKNELLVIKEKHSTVGFKLPGGHIDDAELIQSAVKREVYEETGVNVCFDSIVSLGHFYPHQFNKSNLYILCRAKPLSLEIDIQDTDEIVEAKWIDVQEYINEPNGFDYNKQIVKAALSQEGLVLNHLDSLKKIPRAFELFFPKT